MPFKKGNELRKGVGRGKGNKNKVPNKTKEMIQAFVDGVSEKELLMIWNSIKDPSRKIDAYLKMTKFVVPELKSVEQNLHIEDTITTVKYVGGDVVAESNGD